MTSKWVWSVSKITRRIWFRATLFSLLAVATALIAIVVSPYIPSDLPTKIGADAVDRILGIIASSMLTVTTFSLSTMVSAYSAATTNVTPRATPLVMEDTTTQNVLATFVGSFLFSLVGIVALTTGAYGEQGRLVLFVVTMFIIVLIIVTLLRWIDHLSRLGRVTETTERVEQATLAALRKSKSTPNFGCTELEDGSGLTGPPNVPVYGEAVGYVQHIDVGALARIADEALIEIAVLAAPGVFVSRNEPICWITMKVKGAVEKRIISSFTIGDTRSFDEDPRFGASVLTEIASRALSPAMNDPGTAIDVITRAVRLLSAWADTEDANGGQIDHPKLHMRPLLLADLFDDLFTPVARDGAGIVEVGLRLQKALRSLALLDGKDFRENAIRHSEEAMRRAEAALQIPEDIRRLQSVAIAAD